MQEELITLGLMIVIASAIALIMRRLGQPLLLGYVIAGFLLGPAVTGMIDDPTPLLTFVTELGLIFLMFIIGLELDLSKLRDVGKTSALVGTIQVVVVTIVCGGLSMLFGYSIVQGIYLGLVVSFSSTIVVVKILTEIKEIDSLHGELVLGILVIQDVLAVIGLSILSALKPTAAAQGQSLVQEEASHSLIDMVMHAMHVVLPHSALVTVATLLVNLILFSLVVYLFYKYAMPWMFKQALTNTELLFIVTLAVVFVLAAFAGLFAFSLAMGAFLAGIALSTATYSHEILGRVKPLKDFFLVLFFVGLGMQIVFQNFVSQVPLIIFILVGSLLIKPIVTFFACKLFKYNNRTAFFVSLHLAQVSEFGLVLVASGIVAGALSANMLTGVVICTIATMVLTAYLIKYDEELYQVFKPVIAPLDAIFGTRSDEHRNVPERFQPEVVIMGVNSMTAEAVELLHNKKKILVVDYNPAKILSYKERGIATICSDATNLDIYEGIDFSKTTTVVSVLHQHNSNLFLLKMIREINHTHKTRITTIMSASHEDWGKKLYRAGATLVLIPDVMGRRMLSEVLSSDDPATIRNVGRVYFEELHKNFVYIREI
jgi:Kef-type K+ transport system membrane component KefB